MKLLFDQNLSYHLIKQVKDLYPDSNHVRLLGLDTSDDQTIWNYARSNGYVIVSFDSDFSERSLLFGFPPKVIWLRCGNTSSKNILKVLRQQHERLLQFESDSHASCLEIY